MKNNAPAKTMKYSARHGLGLCGLVLLSGFAGAAPKSVAPVVELTQAVTILEGTYTGLLNALKAEMEKQLPAIDQAKVAAWRVAINAEEGPAKEAAEKIAAVEKMQAAADKLREWEENQKLGPKTLADVNFLASTQAREDSAAFMRVKRAQWIGALVGEDAKPGVITYSGKTRGSAPKKGNEIEKPIFWTDLALQEQRRIIAAVDSGKIKSSGTAPVAAKVPATTGNVTVDDKGVITIPSAACSSPTGSTSALYRGGRSDLIVFVKNKAGDTHLHLSRYSRESDTFEYAFDAPRGGKDQLVASVVTPMPKQKLFAAANGGAAVEMALPYTTGLWDKTAPAEIGLKAGGNLLKFHGPARVTVGRFTLTPMN